MELEKLREERGKLAHKRRRIIMNDDGCGFWPPSVLGFEPPTSIEEFLSRRTKGLEGTQVDTISWCPVHSGFGWAIYNTKVCDIMGRDRKEGAIAAPGGWNHPDALLEGKDCLEIIIDFCRRHDIEMWAAIRMDDNHDQWRPTDRTPWKADRPERWLAQPLDMGGGLEEKAFLISEAALEHPERWVPRGSCGCWYNVDYGREDVREKIFEIIADICERYEVDGIELDFLRGPLYFSANAQGQPDAGQENRDKMTALVRRLRKMTEEVGMRRGRPIVVAARTPDDVEMAKAIGFETPLWLEEGLIDILIVGAAWRIRPWRESVELGHSHGVPVYACAIESGAPHEVIRGRALAAWAGGVDGIYTFNEFDPKSLVWNELGDPEKLQQLDRITPVWNARIRRYFVLHMKRLAGVGRFLARAPRLPLSLPVGEEKTFEFTAGEEGPRVAASTTPHASLHLEFHNIEDGDKISLALNAHSLKDEEVRRDFPRAGWIACRLDPSFLRWGENCLSIKLEKRAVKAWGQLALANLELRVAAQPEVFTGKTAGPSGEAGTRKEMQAAAGLKNLAFVLTKDNILPPPGRVTALGQWLLDELNFGRPRVPGARDLLEKQYNYRTHPSEKPLPGWSSLAVLFDTDKLPNPCEKDLVLSFLRKVESQGFKGEAGLYAECLAGTENLAGVIIRSQSGEDMEYVAHCFGEDCEMEGLLPLPIRFLRAEGDGHLITTSFAVVLRGTLMSGTFTQEKECWEKNLAKEDDLANTTWRLE